MAFFAVCLLINKNQCPLYNGDQGRTKVALGCRRERLRQVKSEKGSEKFNE